MVFHSTAGRTSIHKQLNILSVHLDILTVNS